MLHVLPFDEGDYLAANADVRQAVAAGGIASGFEHYELYGRSEDRPLRTRSAWLRKDLDLARSRGAEIGPLSRPTVRKSEGSILYVDFATREELARKYADDPDVDVEDIVDVDVLWGDRPLSQALAEHGPMEYILASHVAEHVPDLVSWLAELNSVLAPGGCLRLVVPDRRFTFDYFRSITEIADVLDAYLRKARVPQPRQILDFMIWARDVDVIAAWQGDLQGAKENPSATRVTAALTAAQEALEGKYHDSHCWVFTPHSFARLFGDLARLGFVRMACRQLQPTYRNGFEFYAELVASDDPAVTTASWEAAAASAIGADG